jgi:hypothetical protein
MDVVQVYCLPSKAAQTGIQSLDELTAKQAVRRKFASNHHRSGIPLETGTQQALGLPETVDLSGVKEVHPRIDERTKGLEDGVIILSLRPSVGPGA